jgi:hypothetical protein
MSGSFQIGLYAFTRQVSEVQILSRPRNLLNKSG